MHHENIADTVISTARLELRPLTPKDAAEIFAAITPELPLHGMGTPSVARRHGREPIDPDIGHGGWH